MNTNDPLLTCVDNTENGKWQKQWETLCSRVRILTPAEAEQCSFMQRDVLLLHRSVFLTRAKLNEFVQSIIKRWGNHCVAVVSSGGCPYEVSDDGRVSFLRTPFPNSTSLSYMAGRISKLMLALGEARAASGGNQKSCFLKAWEEFDRTVEHSALIALAILCQGYLVARGRADLLYEGASTTSLRPLTNRQRIAQVVTEAKWWLEPFDGINLKEEVAKECNGPIPKHVETLLSRIEARINLDNQDDDTVANALRETRNALKQ
ncbi:MAG: hypothetical protein C4586_07650 [Anaerolineaceae bacterium]|nr:MAG: hypothetical protein C4586_07650 [Anaerolineaceae bacterium]